MKYLDHYLDVDDAARESLARKPQTTEDFEADSAKMLTRTREELRSDAKNLLQ